MNKLIIPNGGMPFEGDDLLYMQDQLRDTFKAILKALSPDSGNFILQGCEVSADSGNTLISAGYVVLDYEVLPFSGATLVTDNVPAKAFGLEITYDPAGNEVFADNVSKDTYEVRKAVIKDIENIPNELKLSDIKRLGKLISELKDLYTEIDVVLSAGFNGFMKLYRHGKKVSIRGYISAPALTSLDGLVLANLPAGLSVVGNYSFVLPSYPQSSYTPSLDSVSVLELAYNVFKIHSQTNSVYLSGTFFLE